MNNNVPNNQPVNSYEGYKKSEGEYADYNYTTPVEAPAFDPRSLMNAGPKSHFEMKYGADPNAGPSSTYTPYLRLSFKEGDANAVVRVNQDPEIKKINRLGWQSFNNYAWEANEELDNPLHALNIIDETRRFYAPLDKDEIMHEQAVEAVNESYNQCKECYSVPPQAVLDGESCILDTRGDGNLSLLSPDETEMVFHNVYLDPWIEIPEDSPWKQFTQIEGTQLPDSMLADSERYAANDNPMLRFQNAFISSTDA